MHVDLALVAILFSLKCFPRVRIFGVSFVPDIDECSSENECDVNARCCNTIGSYNCICKKGYGGGGRNCSGKVRSNERTIASNAESFDLQVLHKL